MLLPDRNHELDVVGSPQAKICRYFMLYSRIFLCEILLICDSDVRLLFAYPPVVGTPLVWFLPAFGGRNTPPIWHPIAFGGRGTPPIWHPTAFGGRGTPPIWLLAAFGGRGTPPMTTPPIWDFGRGTPPIQHQKIISPLRGDLTCKTGFNFII